MQRIKLLICNYNVQQMQKYLSPTWTHAESFEF